MKASEVNKLIDEVHAAKKVRDSLHYDAQRQGPESAAKREWENASYEYLHVLGKKTNALAAAGKLSRPIARKILALLIRPGISFDSLRACGLPTPTANKILKFFSTLEGTMEWAISKDVVAIGMANLPPDQKAQLIAAAKMKDGELRRMIAGKIPRPQTKKIPLAGAWQTFCTLRDKYLEGGDGSALARKAAEHQAIEMLLLMKDGGFEFDESA